MGILYTSYFSKLKDGNGIKISIARFNPKWLDKYEIDWFIDLAPTSSLLFDYKNNNITVDDFRDRYYKELLTNPNSKKQLATLSGLLKSGNDVTVYCYEKPGDFCHRHLLGDIFKNFNFKVEELGFNR